MIDTGLSTIFFVIISILAIPIGIAIVIGIPVAIVFLIVKIIKKEFPNVGQK